MKNSFMFFMLLLTIMNCDMSTNLKLTNEKILLYSLVVNNNVNNYYSPSSEESEIPSLNLNCSTECLTISKKYTYVDPIPGNIICTDNFLNGNNDGLPNQGERAILRIPLVYYGGSILSNIEAELISNDSKIIVNRSIISYPNMKISNKKQFSCPNTYYEEWRDINNSSIQCNYDYISACAGWRITISNDFFGKPSFKILIKTNSGDKILNYNF